MEEEVISMNEVKYMIYNANRRDVKVLIALLYLLGARISEVLLMKKKHFKIVGDKVMIKKKVLKREYYVHTVPLSLGCPFIKSILKYVAELDDDNEKLFCFNRISAWRYLKKINPRVFPHLFRHSKGTRLAEAGATEYQIQTFFGMKDSRTPSRYIRTSSKLVEPLADVV